MWMCRQFGEILSTLSSQLSEKSYRFYCLYMVVIWASPEIRRRLRFREPRILRAPYWLLKIVVREPEKSVFLQAWSRLSTPLYIRICAYDCIYIMVVGPASAHREEYYRALTA